jgi:hypothetical protein
MVINVCVQRAYNNAVEEAEVVVLALAKLEEVFTF